MKTRIVVLLLAVVTAFGSNVLIFDTQTTFSKDYLTSVNTAEYQGRADVLINPALPEGVPWQFTKVTNSLVVPMTQSESNALVAAAEAIMVAATRKLGRDPITDFTGQGLVIRAFADTARDEINILRQELNQAKTNFAAWQLAPTLANRTLAQLKTSITNKINSGSVD